MDKVQIRKTLIIIITSLVWAINFRSTFKCIDAHMDSGSYSSIKFDPIIILIKNCFSCLYFIVYFYSLKLSSSTVQTEKVLIEKQRDSSVVFEYKEQKIKDNFFEIMASYHNLYTKKDKILFYLKIFFIILFIYFSEEAYFIIANNHILDRLAVPMRNLGVLIPVYIFSSLLIKQNWNMYKHQLYPSIIIIIFSLFIIIFNFLSVDRFEKIFNENFFYYMIVFILTGIELVLIKYLVEKEIINIFFILGLKGIIGTIIFSIINLTIKKDKFFYFFDYIFNFEYDNMYVDDFNISLKIIYIISLLVLEYLKLFTINEFTESHFLSVSMITDVFYFIFYLIEKFVIYKFPITTSITFFINIILGFINTILLLIFNEIIELKVFGIEKNLNKNINKRQNEEMSLIELQINNIKKNNNIEEDNSDDEDEQ